MYPALPGKSDIFDFQTLFHQGNWWSRKRSPIIPKPRSIDFSCQNWFIGWFSIIGQQFWFLDSFSSKESIIKKEKSFGRRFLKAFEFRSQLYFFCSLWMNKSLHFKEHLTQSLGTTGLPAKMGDSLVPEFRFLYGDILP